MRLCCPGVSCNNGQVRTGVFPVLQMGHARVRPRRWLPSQRPLPAVGILRATALPGGRCVRASAHLVTSCKLPPVSTPAPTNFGKCPDLSEIALPELCRRGAVWLQSELRASLFNSVSQLLKQSCYRLSVSQPAFVKDSGHVLGRS